MKRLAVMLVAISGCSGSKPETTYFAELSVARLHAAQICASVDSAVLSTYGTLPMSYWMLSRNQCDLALDSQHERRQGIVPIEVQGGVGDKRTGACAVRIGPAPIVGTVPATMVVGFVGDPLLRQALIDKIGVIDDSREYSLQTSVSGIQIDLRQHISRLGAKVRTVIEMRLEGCAQFADTHREERTVGDSIATPAP